MATGYTPKLKLALPTSGELSGTWGTVVNNEITSMIEEAIAGLAVVNTWSTNSHVLDVFFGQSASSRAAMLQFTDTLAGLSGDATVVCPSTPKIYIAKNNVGAGRSVTLKTAAGTGVTIPDGATAFVMCDGNNVIEAITAIQNIQSNMSFVDNAVLRFGTGNDVEHFWDGVTYYTDVNGGANWVVRDGDSGNAARFTFDIDNGTLTATTFIGALSGNATTATNWASASSITLSGDVTGTANINGTTNANITTVVGDDSHNHTASTVDSASTATANKIVVRDASANFSANVITAALSGNATTATSAAALTTPRTISISGDVSGSVAFDGSADVNIPATVAVQSVNLTDYPWGAEDFQTGTDERDWVVDRVLTCSSGSVTNAAGKSFSEASTTSATTYAYTDSTAIYAAGTVTVNVVTSRNDSSYSSWSCIIQVNGSTVDTTTGYIPTSYTRTVSVNYGDTVRLAIKRTIATGSTRVYVNGSVTANKSIIVG